MKRVKFLVAITLALFAIAGWSVASMKRVGYHGYVFMTDTALSTEAHFIRHRSLTDLYEVFGLGPGLLPYFASDYLYAPPPYLNACQEMR